MREYPRKSRLDPQLLREITTLIREDLTDPRIRGVTITRVDMSPDMRQAKVMVSVLGNDNELNAAVAALKNAAGRLRRGLGARLRLRFTPQLFFYPDVQMREAAHVNRLIREARSEDDQNAGDREEP